MGNRKRSSVQNLNQTQSPHSPPSPSPSPSPSDSMPCSSIMELLPEEKQPLHAFDSSVLKPLSSVLDVTDSSMKLQNTHSPVQYNQSLGRSIFIKRSRHFYGHQYSRRNPSNANASSSRGKGTPLLDDKLSFKFTPQCNQESGRLSEISERAFFRPERIRSSSLVMDSVSTHVRIVCGICQKPLKRKPFFRGSTLSSSEPSVVAVLVCGHVYHADCLEEKTSFGDRQDPHCPVCTGLLSKVEDLKERE